MRLELDTSGLFGRIVALAERGYGIVTLGQLLGTGCSQAWVQRQLAAGRLHRLHRGVYSIVPPGLLKAEGRWLAAVSTCGPGAVLSHTDAAALWELRWFMSGRIHVTVPTHAGRPQRRGIRLHRSITLTPSHVTVHRGIPVTSVRRTLADLRRTLPPGQFKEVLRKAHTRRLDTGLQADTPPDPERSELERRFHALCRRHSLPLPRAQQIIGPYTVDFLWPAERLIVEVDGWATHGSPTAFEDDRARDAWLTAQGYRVVRFTWRQVTREGPWVAQAVRSLLAAGASPAAVDLKPHGD